MVKVTSPIVPETLEHFLTLHKQQTKEYVASHCTYPQQSGGQESWHLVKLPS